MRTMTRITAITSSGPSRLLILAGLAAATLFAAANVSAHAAYVSSSPAFAEALSEPPDAISIRFTQELFRRDGANAISLRHIDSDASIAVGEPIIENQDRRVMTAALPQRLDPGRYLVSWINLSAEDGDTDSGSYPFYVGRAASADEVADDRQLAADLLVAYPDDQADAPGGDSDDPAGSAAVDPASPAVVRSEAAAEAELGAAPIILLAAGLVAMLILIGALGYRLGARRRAA